MKLRNGFVSNSSSSSFVCNTSMTLEEIEIKLNELLRAYNNFFDTQYSFEQVFKKPFIADKKYKKEMDAWNYECPVGSKVIAGYCDNSIPYLMFDWIEEKFNAHRNHLG